MNGPAVIVHDEKEMTQAGVRYLVVNEEVWRDVDRTRALLERPDVVHVGRLPEEAEALKAAMERDESQKKHKTRRVACPACGASIKLTTIDAFGAHLARYHGNLPMRRRDPCALCDGRTVANVVKHAKQSHVTRALPKDAVGPLFSVVVVVDRRTSRVLLVNEHASEGWWLPAGHVDAGETFVHAALRETKEEAGVDVELRGLLALEHSARFEHNKIRAIFLAEVDEAALASQLKRVPDYESQGAAFFSLAELSSLRWRSKHELKTYIEPLLQNAAAVTVYPLTVLSEH